MLLLGESDGSNDDTDDIIPKEFRLLGNYPNPFNPETTIKFELPVSSKIEIAIFNILGQKVRKIEITNMDAGLREISWNGKNEHGKLMPSGMYIYRFKAESREGKKMSFTKSRKMLMIK